jgi:hypothetical protein
MVQALRVQIDRLPTSSYQTAHILFAHLRRFYNTADWLLLIALACLSSATSTKCPRPTSASSSAQLSSSLK